MLHATATARCPPGFVATAAAMVSHPHAFLKAVLRSKNRCKQETVRSQNAKRQARGDKLSQDVYHRSDDSLQNRSVGEKNGFY